MTQRVPVKAGELIIFTILDDEYAIRLNNRWLGETFHLHHHISRMTKDEL